MKCIVVQLSCLYFSIASNYPTTTITPYPTTTKIPHPSPSTTPNPPGCPDGWIDGGYLGCFYFDSEEKKVNWVEAQAACEMMGGYLAEIKTQEQDNFIESLAIIEENFTGVKSWWVGLSDMGHEGRWMWGHSVADADFTSWAPGHPNSEPGNQDDCVAITLSEHFHWKDVSCSKTHSTSPSPICQRDVESFTTTEPVPTTTTFQGCPNDWSEYQSSCYKMFTSSKDWSDARDYCRSLGAELPSIQSFDENNLIYSIASGYSSHDVWIGGTDEKVEGVWEWVDGSIWSFENWISGQPDGGSSQNALTLDTSERGEWRDRESSQHYYFLCKMY